MTILIPALSRLSMLNNTLQSTLIYVIGYDPGAENPIATLRLPEVITARGANSNRSII